jgi:hypothetical protein
MYHAQNIHHKNTTPLAREKRSDDADRSPMRAGSPNQTKHIPLEKLHCSVSYDEMQVNAARAHTCAIS